jgi:hypothetical protein
MARVNVVGGADVNEGALLVIRMLKVKVGDNSPSLTVTVIPWVPVSENEFDVIVTILVASEY